MTALPEDLHMFLCRLLINIHVVEAIVGLSNLRYFKYLTQTQHPVLRTEAPPDTAKCH
jgi:hypothetical protein